MCEQINGAIKLAQHFYNNSLTFNLNQTEIESFTWTKQEEFLRLTIHREIIKKYPVSSKFSKLFFKKVIAFLEPIQVVHDDLYKYLCSILESNDNEEFCYRHYLIQNNFNDVITIKETKNMVVNGTTGMRTWQGALILADWIICNKKLFHNKNVLELGSGVGFTGIAIAKECDVASIVLSDFHEEVLNSINENVEINFSNSNRQNNNIGSANINHINVMKLDWCSFDSTSNYIVPDIIIGADIIYDPTILRPLCNVFDYFFKRNSSLEIYITNIIRNEATYRRFLEMIDSLNWSHEEISHPKSILVKWDESTQKCLLKIYTNY